MSDTERAARVPTEILFVASEYGARNEVAPHILLECCNLVIQKFGHLHIHEIREAYRSWASEENSIEGAEFYGGQFNARQLGRVLAAYDTRRRAILADFLSAKETWERERQEEQYRKARQQSFEATFPDRIRQVKQAKTWEEIPEFVYHTLRKRALLSITKTEALAILEAATRIAEQQIEEEKRNRQHRYAFIPSIEDRAASIARKMTVFQKITQSPAWQLPEDWNQNK